MRANLNAGRRHTGPQDHRDRARFLRIVDMDRQKAALVIMRIEERQLLMSMDDIAGIVDVQYDPGRRPRVRGDPLIDERIGEMDHVTQGWRVFEPGQRRLRDEIPPRIGQPPAGQLEGGVDAQEIKIVGILIAAADCENAGADHFSETVSDARGIAAVRNAARQPFGDPEAALRQREQHDAAIRSETPTIKSGGHFFSVRRLETRTR